MHVERGAWTCEGGREGGRERGREGEREREREKEQPPLLSLELILQLLRQDCQKISISRYSRYLKEISRIRFQFATHFVISTVSTQINRSINLWFRSSLKTRANATVSSDSKLALGSLSKLRRPIHARLFPVSDQSNSFTDKRPAITMRSA